jgi:hypothetical protein
MFVEEDNAPLPPIRGRFGRYIRPLPPENRPGAGTVSPFAVPDGIYTEGIMSRRAIINAGMSVPRHMIPRQFRVNTDAALRSPPTYGQVDGWCTDLEGMGDGAPVPTPVTSKETLEELLERTSKELKQQIIETTAAQMATTVAVSAVILTLNVIPIVGWIINIAWAALQAAFAVAAAHYQREAQRIMSNLTNELKLMGGAYQASFDEEKLRIFNEERGAAIQLALSSSDLPDIAPKAVEGLGASWWSKLVSPVYHATEVLRVSAKPVREVVRAADRAGLPGANKVAAEMDRTDKLVKKIQDEDQHIYAKASGEEIRNIAREQAAKARVKAAFEFEAQYQKALASLRTPEFRHNLRLQTARFIRQQPHMAELITNARGAGAQRVVEQMVSDGRITQDQVVAAAEAAAYPGGSRAATYLPAVGAVAAVLLIGSMKS